MGGEIHNPGKVSIRRSGGIRGWYDVDKVERLTAAVVVVQGRSSPSRESLQGGTSALVGPCPLAPTPPGRTRARSGRDRQPCSSTHRVAAEESSAAVRRPSLALIRRR